MIKLHTPYAAIHPAGSPGHVRPHCNATTVILLSDKAHYILILLQNYRMSKAIVLVSSALNTPASCRVGVLFLLYARSPFAPQLLSYLYKRALAATFFVRPKTRVAFSVCFFPSFLLHIVACTDSLISVGLFQPVRGEISAG